MVASLRDASHDSSGVRSREIERLGARFVNITNSLGFQVVQQNRVFTIVYRSTRTI